MAWKVSISQSRLASEHEAERPEQGPWSSWLPYHQRTRDRNGQDSIRKPAPCYILRDSAFLAGPAVLAVPSALLSPLKTPSTSVQCDREFVSHTSMMRETPTRPSAHISSTRPMPSPMPCTQTLSSHEYVLTPALLLTRRQHFQCPPLPSAHLASSSSSSSRSRNHRSLSPDPLPTTPSWPLPKPPYPSNKRNDQP